MALKDIVKYVTEIFELVKKNKPAFEKPQLKLSDQENYEEIIDEDLSPYFENLEKE